MKKSIQLLTIGMILTLCAGFASCGGGSSSSSSSSSTPSTSTSTSSSTPALTHHSAPQIVDFYSDARTKQSEEIVEYCLMWDFVKNASSYLVAVNGEEIETEENYCFLASYLTVSEENTVTVQAKGDGKNYADSEPTEGVYIPKPVTQTFDYVADEIFALEGTIANYPEDLYLPDRRNGREIKSVSIASYSTESSQSVKRVWLPKGVEWINGNAFANFTALERVFLEDESTLKTIETGAFSNCALERVEIPVAVESIGEGAFGGSKVKEIVVDENNQNFCAIDGNLYSKDTKTFVEYAGGKTEEEFTVPDFVETVCGVAFYGCASLKKIVFPNSVKKFDGSIVVDCDEVTEIVLSNGVENAMDVFVDCGKLKSIVYPEGVVKCVISIYESFDFVVIPNSVKNVNFSFFVDVKVYYHGTEEEWEKVGRNERALEHAILYFYSDDEPEGEGNFWHYNRAGDVEIWE